MGAGILPTILDNMIADHRLPAMVAVMIDSGGGDAQGSERGLEYDTVSGKCAEFIESEVLLRAAQECHVVFTKNPDGRMTMGGAPAGRARSPWRGSTRSFITACFPTPGPSL